jgi:hypothetical protein
MGGQFAVVTSSRQDGLPRHRNERRKLSSRVKQEYSRAIRNNVIRIVAFHALWRYNHSKPFGVSPQ